MVVFLVNFLNIQGLIIGIHLIWLISSQLSLIKHNNCNTRHQKISTILINLNSIENSDPAGQSKCLFLEEKVKLKREYLYYQLRRVNLQLIAKKGLFWSAVCMLFSIFEYKVRK